MAITPAKTTTAVPAGTQPSATAKITKDVVEMVASKVHAFISNGELHLPQHYSPDNALKSAWLLLQNTVDMNKRPALQVCTKDSVANALLDMIVQGLNPGKKQGYLIVYGNQLVFQRSYFGAMAVAQMVNPDIKEFAYAVVYEGDKFKYGIKYGKKIVQDHEQELANVDKKKIIAAYCIALDKNGEPLRTEIMAMDEIKQSWKQSKMNPVEANGSIKAGSTHDKFSTDMALKTVINKACKVVINASSDNHLLLERINRNEDLADRAAVSAEIDETANRGPVLELPPTTEETPTASGMVDAVEVESNGDGQGEPGQSEKTNGGRQFLYDYDKCSKCPKVIMGCPKLPNPPDVDACPGPVNKSKAGF